MTKVGENVLSFNWRRKIIVSSLQAYKLKLATLSLIALGHPKLLCTNIDNQRWHLHSFQMNFVPVLLDCSWSFNAPIIRYWCLENQNDAPKICTYWSQPNTHLQYQFSNMFLPSHKTASTYSIYRALIKWWKSFP